MGLSHEAGGIDLHLVEELAVVVGVFLEYGHHRLRVAAGAAAILVELLVCPWIIICPRVVPAALQVFGTPLFIVAAGIEGPVLVEGSTGSTDAELRILSQATLGRRVVVVRVVVLVEIEEIGEVLARYVPLVFGLPSPLAGPLLLKAGVEHRSEALRVIDGPAAGPAHIHRVLEMDFVLVHITRVAR